MRHQNRAFDEFMEAPPDLDDIRGALDHRIGNPVHGSRGGGDLAPGIDQGVENLGLDPTPVHDPHGSDLHDLIALGW